jgi:hypothetical protein
MPIEFVHSVMTLIMNRPVELEVMFDQAECPAEAPFTRADLVNVRSLQRVVRPRALRLCLNHGPSCVVVCPVIRR